MDCSLPDPPVHGILQARILEWITISSSRDLSNPGIEPVSLPPALAGQFLTTSAIWEALHPEYFALKKKIGIKEISQKVISYVTSRC